MNCGRWSGPQRPVVGSGLSGSVGAPCLNDGTVRNFSSSQLVPQNTIGKEAALSLHSGPVIATSDDKTDTVRTSATYALATGQTLTAGSTEKQGRGRKNALNTSAL